LKGKIEASSEAFTSWSEQTHPGGPTMKNISKYAYIQKQYVQTAAKTCKTDSKSVVQLVKDNVWGILKNDFALEFDAGKPTGGES
jgi:hypothetical protein